ncbi:YggS family pyridoxal phosphate-dependent enzyme [Candidatus Palauibacter sp.]|uniref:YggS family pyridoxal phosphate-dependent enzyme n=1 Tax=Candidatus Palauibacter sp. TaxID=3101350 RepID=UPI003B01DB67
MTRDDVEARLARVLQRIEAAAGRAGRRPDDVEILPVTKGHPARAIEIVEELGLARIGENRVPEAEAKRSALGATPGVAWHLIGRLQRNKARRALRLFDVVESVDSVMLARTLSRIVEEERLGPAEVLVQVNPSGEAVKAGFAGESAVDAVREICALPGLRVRGLMAMAPFTDDEAVLRPVFRGAASLLARCRDEIPEFGGDVLSMGMSNDFEIAVEEGSTRLRLGTVLLGER